MTLEEAKQLLMVWADLQADRQSDIDEEDITDCDREEREVIKAVRIVVKAAN